MSTFDDFPEFRLPKQGGLHPYLFKWAMQSAERGIDPVRATDRLRAEAGALSYRRDAKDPEILGAIASAYRIHLEGRQATRPQWEHYDKSAAEIAFQEFGLTVDSLLAKSPQKPPGVPHECLPALFRPDDLVCLAGKITSAQTRPLRDWLGLPVPLLKRYQFAVPHPMSERIGHRKGDGAESARCHGNTGPRVRVVCDFDHPEKEHQPSLIAHLTHFARQDPELVLTTGGRSLHAWWRIEEWPADRVEAFENEAARVGADAALLGDSKKCQLVRLPAGTRKGGKHQQILFWNPKPL